MSNQIFTCPPEEMKSTGNMLLHGLYLGLYGFVKHLSFPFSNYLRYGVIRLFSRGIKSKHIMDGVTIWFPWRVKIGKNSSLNQGVLVDGFGGVTIGDGVRIAAYTCINTADHDFTDPNVPVYESGYRCAAVVIQNNVWIGNQVSINKGVTISSGVIIGAGSVVTKDIPQDMIAVGAPAKPIRLRVDRSDNEVTRE